ncbi:DcaP family trimeric outer membrane transporter [Stenotrophomonas sp. Marseille-Q4652]|uniref:DcaP family trimeric outer membrane transporter n=1 Tax=Stenotrophomonas sp. Marseille-Q4652 TaxID=2866595 RepID=UPI001CE4B4D8|nr:DcaP family trimeric outer membrane transporter [Stenotrophomonas sp. Marseille-Q4652]
MNQSIVRTTRKPLAAALFVALVAPGLALAQTPREKALEARVADLERQVQLLLSAQQQQQGQISQAQEQVSQVQAAQAERPVVPAGKQPIQATTVTPGAAPGTTFKFGGFIKADFLATQTGDGQLADDATGRALYLPGQTPVHGAGGSGQRSDVDYNAHAKFSRFNLGVDHVTESGDKAGALVEMDFFGNSLGNQTATNTYGVTLRHAYMYWNNWLAGQTWSNFMDAGSLPEAVDFVGPTDGVLFVRQAQIRYTNGGFSVALENPETTLIGLGNSDRGSLPDLTLRYGWKGDWGTFGVAGLLRQLKVDNTTTGADATKAAGGLTLGGKWVMGSSDTLHYQLTGGEGISRYVGLGITADSAYDAIRDELNPTGVMAGYVGWRHAFSPKLRTNLIYARSDYDNESAITGNLVTKSVQSIRGNVFYTPMPKVDVGAELMYGVREIENGNKGDIRRVQFTTKYSF